jgi:DMSO/TMAO reductase YedYZ molybdopterin-dependent catalytic subunit
MAADEDIPPPDSKLTRSKRSWAQVGRFLTGRSSQPETDRLPPGQHLVRDWPVLDLGEHPAITQQNWRLLIGGAVENPLVWEWADFEHQPQTRSLSDIHCVTSWSRYDNEWGGVATRHLLEIVEPTPEAGFVLLHSYDGYTTNLTLQDFAAEGALLAHSWQGQPLTRDHGGPVRLVVPHLYFWKSAKWLKRIEFLAQDYPGFWELNGYHNRGDPWREERYTSD